MDWYKLAMTLWWVVLTMYYYLETLVILVLPRKYRYKDVRGNVTLVTGGGSGIGRLMCLKLARRGALVITWDISETDNRETARQIKAEGGHCRAYTVDLCDRHAVYAAATKVKQEVGKVDILINNAGIVTGKTLLHCPDTSIIRTFEVNTISHFWTMKAFLGDMMVRNKGHIVTVASALGKVPINGLVDYCSSKYGAVGFDEALRMELRAMGKSGIKTTLVCPGMITTGMFDGVPTDDAVEPDYVAEEVVNAVEMNVPVLYVPLQTKMLVILRKIVPEKSFYKMMELMNATRAMETFVGRQKTH